MNTSIKSPPASQIQEAFSVRNAIMKFVVSMNTGNIRDNKLTQESIDTHDVQGRRLSVRKYIMSGNELNAVITAVQSARNYFNEHSLPWMDEGVRIVPATSVIDIKTEMEERIRDIMTKIDTLIAALPDIIERDKATLKDTFNAADYPTADQLRAKYSARIEIRPVSVDFRVQGIEESAQKIIQEQIESQINEALKDAKIYQLEKLGENIQHLASKLTNKKTFKGSSIQNIIDSAVSIRDLSLDEDDKMQKISDEIRKDFSSLNADTLREDDKARKAAADLANKRLQEINDAMKGFM